MIGNNDGLLQQALDDAFKTSFANLFGVFFSGNVIGDADARSRFAKGIAVLLESHKQAVEMLASIETGDKRAPAK